MDCAGTERGEVLKDGQSLSIENPPGIPIGKSVPAKEEARKPSGGNDALEQRNVEDSQPEQNWRVQQNSQHTSSEIQMLRQQLENCQQKLSHYQETARISQNRVKMLETEKQVFMERCKDAESTLLRLRPQRQQCTETEVRDDYELLKASIQTWVDNHCTDFLDDEQLGCDMIGDDTPKRHNQVQSHEIVLRHFHSEPNRWDDAKDQLLIAIIMRYVVDKIISRPYPLGLSQEDQALLAKIEDSLNNLEPRRDLQTRRNWRSDAIAAVYHSRTYADGRTNSARNLTRGLFNIVRKTIPNSGSDVTKSLLSEVIEPSQALAKKIQCASTDWRFEYSPYWNCPPGQSATHLPQFFDSIANFQCHNLSENRKTLKPANDLATRDQKESLMYILDLYPGLYCSRVDVDELKPALTIAQPVLIVGYIPKNLGAGSTASQPRTRSADGRQPGGSSAAMNVSFIGRLLRG